MDGESSGRDDDSVRGHGDTCGNAHGRVHGAPDRVSGRLRAALLVTLLFMAVELVGGVLANSLALIADAGHMLTDVGALALSLFAVWFTRRQLRIHGEGRRYLQWEIVAALVNGATLLVVCGGIGIEAFSRLRSPEEVAPGLMAAVAAAGLIANAFAARILHPEMAGSLNVRGAYLHVLGDLLASVGTLVAAIVIALTGWLPADPIASVFTALLVVRAGWKLVVESVDVLVKSASTGRAQP